MLERLERGDISSVIRQDLDVKLKPTEIEHRLVTYGDFARMNNLMNNENSQSTRYMKDPTVWLEYHRQYEEISKTWSIKPVIELMKRIKELSPRLQIGDFGCGKADILKALGHERVHSFDFASINDNVTSCDMKSVPLKDGDLDVVVFSLSLMAINWINFIAEAKRWLATNGYLLIADTTKAVKKRLSKIYDVIKE